MNIILKQYVENLGAANELVSVKPGYARNFLIPRGMAVEANESNRKILKEKEKVALKKQEELMSKISDVEKALNDGNVILHAKVGENGKIYGSITSLQLSRAIEEQKQYQIDRKKIEFEEAKEVGEYTAQIKFDADNTVDFTFEIKPEATES